MRQIGLAIILTLAWVSCSPRNDQKQPLFIDKTQIDLPQSDPYSYPPSQRTKWHCTLLSKAGPEDENALWKRIKAMQGQPVNITDGREVLASGEVIAIIESQGKYLGPVIAFPTAEV